MADPREDPFLDDPESVEAEIEAIFEDDEDMDPLILEADALRVERDELKDRLLRTLAESENVRKRAERDRREGEQYGGSKLARDLLPIYDNLKRG